MGDGKALQMGTSHELGQNFAAPFDITFSTDVGARLEHVWQTSWGVSTRLVGALVMVHGDDFGLRLPPAVAPAQVVVAVVKDDAAEVGAGRRRALSPSSRRGPPGPPGRPHRHRLWSSVRRLGAEGCAGPSRGRAARSGRGQRDCGRAATAGEETVPLAGAGAGRSTPSLASADRDLPGRGDSRPRRPDGRTPRTLEETVEAGLASASPGSAWALSGPTGRTAWPSTRSPCGACSDPTARWPGPATPRTDLVAVVGPFVLTSGLL